MKHTKLKILSALLAVTMLMSMLTFLPAGAVEIKTEDSDSDASFYAVEDGNGIHYYGPTGNNLTDTDKKSDNVEVIETLSEYKKLVKDTKANGTDTLIRKANKLPNSVDNSQSIYFPEIGDQMDLGSCLFWAQVYYQYTYEYNKLMNIPTTPETTFSPQWSYNVATAGDDVQCYTQTSLTFMKYQGNVLQSQVPYDQEYLKAYPTYDIWRTSINYRIKDFVFLEDIGVGDTQVTSPDDSDLDIMKTALSDGEILTYSTMMYGWTHTELKENANAPENNEHIGECAVTAMDGYEGGHRMTLVGYNDDIWIDINNNDKVDNGEMGAFKIANSWGTEYGSNGFAWVAYDALNKRSCVEGVEHNPDRDCIFTEVTKMFVQPYGTDADIYLQYTLNTADRTQVLTKITAEKDGTVKTLHALSNMIYGVPVAYDGSTYATDATLIFPIQCAFPDVTSENLEDYTWSVEFTDLENDEHQLLVKDAKLVNEATGKTYSQTESYPFSLNGESKSVVINESKLNHAVVYYRGYYSPTISYKLDNSDAKWNYNVPITEDFEQYGYTHKYVIDLKTSDKATLYFSDEDGSVDDNSGAYFTATKGLNYYITENQAKPLTAKMTNDLNGTADVSRLGQFTVETNGGYKPYRYEYVFTNLTTGDAYIDEFCEIQNMGHYFNEEGDYLVVVTVKDSTGVTVSDVNRVKITNIPFEFTTFEATGKNNTCIKNDAVTFTAITNYENSGVRYGEFGEYDFVIKRGDEICYSTRFPMEYDRTNPEYQTTTIIKKWTPTETGEYTATISSTDYVGDYAEKTIRFTVNDCIIGDADGDGNITIVDTTFLQMYLSRAVDRSRLRTLTADTDKDEIISINDATYIQRYLANYPDFKFVGEVL